MDGSSFEGQDVQPAADLPLDPAPAAVAALSAALLAACGGGEGGARTSATAAAPEVFFDAANATTRRTLLGVPAAAAPPASLPATGVLLDWAERHYPHFFPGRRPDVVEPPYQYRHYPATGNYVGVADGQVYVLGPLSGGQLLHVGAVADFAAQVLASVRPGSDEAAARFLLQAQVGVLDEDIAAVRQLGYPAWLEQQFAMPQGQTTWDWLDERGYGTVDRHQYYDSGAPFFDLAAYRQLLSAPDTLRGRIQLALTEYFVVSLASTQPPWPHFAYATYWDGLGRLAFGNFRALLEHVTLCAAMGAYLNTAGNQKEDPATGRVPDENYAREVMQLFTIGLVELQPDGTPRLGPQGRPLETYDADDVTNLARVFTGYQIDDSGPRITPLVGGGWRPAHTYSRRPMRFLPELHSTREARFLGAVVPAGTSGAQALKIALDTLFQHPNLGPFFGRQLIQRLVTSHPSPAYVARVAAAFADNGQGVRGDMRAVIRAVLLDDEARGAASLTSPHFGKLREPALRFLQWGRSFRMVSKAGSWKWGFAYGSPDFHHGQRLFWSPSVFNFFRPGFVPPGTALAATGTTAPEFQIVNETSVAQYVNMLQLLLWQGPWIFAPERRDIDQTEPSPQSGVGDMVPDYGREMALAHDAAALVDRLALLICAGQLSTATRARIVAALQTRPLAAGAPPVDRQLRVAQALLLVMACPEYLVQK